MKRAQQGSIEFLQLLMAASVALPCVLFTYASWINYQNAYTVADERIDRSLTIVEGHADNLFRSVDLLLSATNAQIENLSDDNIKQNESQYHIALEQLVSHLPQVLSLWIFDAQGRPLVSSRSFPVPTTFSNFERDYFHVQINNDAGLYVGTVVDPKVPGEAIFGVSKRRPGAEFKGVVAVAIRPSALEEFYKSIGPTGSYAALLRLSDGAFLARYPAPVALGLKLTEHSSTRQAMASGQERGIFSVTSQTDGVDRRMGYDRLAQFGVFVLAGIDETVITHDWLKLMGSHLIFGVPATAGMFLAILYGMRRTRRLYAEAAARENAEDALRQAQKIEAVGQLTGGVAHDFNNLLMIILGNLAVAKKALEKAGDNISDRLRRAIDNASDGAQRAATLTQRLLAFARQQPLQPQVIDINAAVRAAVPLLQRALGEDRQLEVVTAAGAWNTEIDPSQLEVALLNLVLNARDALPDGGKVTIECGNAYVDEAYAAKQSDVKPGQYVVVSVSDTGVGMSSATASRAFDPFFTTKPTGQGTGLGLSQVFGFIKQSGGHVTIYSELNQGTTVKMYLPRSHVTTKESANVEELPVIAGQGERVLVVEDDTEVRRFVSDTLIDLNYVATAADGPAQALRYVRNHPIDLLLTDVVMPEKNGRQLADEVLQIAPSTKVIFMTGYSRNAIVHHGRLDPGVELLQKPFTREELARRIANALRK
ncbi:MAG: response regulator [Pseudolabrys sp.]|nr:response regulator [Pseudolabrys sp.]